MNKKVLKVITPQGQYPIIIGHNVIADIGTYLKPILKNNRVFIVTSKKVIKIYKKKLLNILNKNNIGAELIIINDSEKQKNFNTISKISNTLLKKGIDRNDSLIAFGGGVVGDLAGFLAASFARGIRFIQIPTTLLAQVDSSVGGKVGVNLPSAKNMVGAFWQPEIVLIDPLVLETLDEANFRAGIAEVIKYGLIMDLDFFEFLESSVDLIERREPGTLARCIARCCQCKAAVVEEDERETSGRRAILNYGHTYGHAIEAVFGFGRFLFLP